LDDSDSKPDSDEQEQDVTARFRTREEVPVHLQGCEEWNSVKDYPAKFITRNLCGGQVLQWRAYFPQRK
jgi:hypothetical protein